MRCTNFRNPFLRWSIGIGYVASFTAMLAQIYLLIGHNRHIAFLGQAFIVICGGQFVSVCRYFLGLPPPKTARKSAVKQATKP